MKCKHENADHLMPGDRFQPYGKYPRQRVGTLTEVQCEQFRCLDCGAWLSLGHSDEEPVAVEVRAAEIVADGAGPHDLFINDTSSWYGWCQHAAATRYADDEATCLPHEEAGWLAREIHTHGGEHGD